MKILDAIRSLFGAGGAVEQRALPASAISSFLGEPTYSGVDVTPETAMRVSAVYACVRVVSESIASLPLFVYERTKDGGRRRASDLPLFSVLHSTPNEWQTSFELRETMAAHLCLRGNAYCEVLRNGAGQVAKLMLRHPDNVRPKVTEKGELVYEVRGRDGLRTLKPGQIWHIRGLSFDNVEGVSPITYAREQIGSSIATDRFGNAFFANAARPSVVVEVPGVLDDEAHKRIQDSWSRAYSGANAGTPAVLEQGTKATPLQMSAKDSQFIETLNYQVVDIARIFRVPPHMIGDLSRATFSNVEQQSLDFVTHTLRPWLVRFEQSIARDLLSEEERARYFAEFAVDGLLRADVAARTAYYQQARMSGWLSVNEIRRLENLDPIGAQGDIYAMPANLLDAGAVKPAA